MHMPPPCGYGANAYTDKDGVRNLEPHVERHARKHGCTRGALTIASSELCDRVNAPAAFLPNPPVQHARSMIRVEVLSMHFL